MECAAVHCARGRRWPTKQYSLQKRRRSVTALQVGVPRRSLGPRACGAVVWLLMCRQSTRTHACTVSIVCILAAFPHSCRRVLTTSSGIRVMAVMEMMGVATGRER